MLGLSGEDIDAIAFTTEGQLAISTLGSATVPGVQGDLAIEDEDMIVQEGDQWRLFFDGSAHQLTSGSEDIHAAWIDEDGLSISTRGAFRMEGLSGGGEDVSRCKPTSPTSLDGPCTLQFEGDQEGLADAQIDAFSIGQAGIKGSTISDDPGDLLIDEDLQEDDVSDDVPGQSPGEGLTPQTFLPLVQP